MSDPVSLLGERHLKAIGLMIIRVSMLESVLLDLVTRVMDTNVFDALIVFEHQQFSSKVLTAKALVNSRPELAELIDTLNRAGNVGDRRNTVVHGYWTIDEHGQPLAVRFTARGELKRTRVPMPPEEIEQIAADAMTTTDTLAEQLNRLFPKAARVP